MERKLKYSVTMLYIDICSDAYPKIYAPYISFVYLQISGSKDRRILSQKSDYPLYLNGTKKLSN